MLSLENTKIRVGFLFINTAAHLYHMATIAFELSYNKQFRVILYVSTNENKDLLEKVACNYPDHTCEFVFLKPTRIHQVSRLLKKRLHPRVRDVINHNKNLLLKDDAIVMTEKHMLNIQGESRPKYIFIGHGPGDRAQGYTPIYKKFDYLLVYGNAKWNRLASSGLVSPQRGKIIGYPKFDNTLNIENNCKIFNNNKPVIIYNPHFNSNESSWQQWGKEILDYFYDNKNYNLIFAPHIMLFAKKRNNLAAKYFKAENIHIDLGSHSLTDMTYTRTADIYLGDVSSQVYEFIGYRCRPCVFLNTHKENWIGNQDFRMWNMGDVVNSISEFDLIISNAQARFSHYEKIQTAYSKDTFSKSNIPAGKRAATAISDFMQKKQV